MKIESRGKYPGVKLHLEPEEILAVLAIEEPLEDPANYMDGELTEESVKVLKKIIRSIKKLQKETPNLLDERTPEQIAAILIKEAEKSQLQLDTLTKTGQIKKLDKDKLQESLLKYVKD